MEILLGMLLVHDASDRIEVIDGKGARTRDRHLTDVNGGGKP
jgi:hypothetical protein